MKQPTLIRFALGYIAIASAQIGFWALFAPRSFYDSFPGMGRAWVSLDGPYNEHLVRDVGALNLAFLALIVFAAVRLTRELVTVAAVATAVWSVPHLIYHLFNTDDLATSDIVISLAGLVGYVAFAGVLLASARSLRDRPERA